MNPNGRPRACYSSAYRNLRIWKATSLRYHEKSRNLPCLRLVPNNTFVDSTKRLLMRRLQTFLSLLCTACLAAQGVFAQSSAVRIEPPKGGLGWLTRPYQQ